MDAEMMENIRQNEKYYRIREGISAKHIGEIAGHSDAWIIMFESGVIKSLRDQDLQKVAGALGVKIKDLVKPAGDPVLSLTDEEHARGLENLEKNPETSEADATAVQHHPGAEREPFPESHGWLQSFRNQDLVEDCRCLMHGFAGADKKG